MVEQGLEPRILSPLWSLADFQTDSLHDAGWLQCLKSYPRLGTLSVALPIFTTVLRREHYWPTSQIRKLRPREEIQLAQGHVARKWWIQASGSRTGPVPPSWGDLAFSLLQPPQARSYGGVQRKG